MEQYCWMLSTIFSFLVSISSRVDSSQHFWRVESSSNLYPEYIARACCLFDGRRDAKSMSSSIYLPSAPSWERIHCIIEPYCIHTPPVPSSIRCLFVRGFG